MKRIIILLLALTLAGCARTPDCGADETLALVSDIAHREYAEHYQKQYRRLFPEVISDEDAASVIENHGFDPRAYRDSTPETAALVMQLTPTMVVQTERDEQNDRYACSATLVGKNLEDNPLRDNVTFRVSRSAQGGEFIVEVFGIRGES